MKPVTIGPISEGTLRPEDLIPAFATVLRPHRDSHSEFAFLLDEADSCEEFSDEELGWLLEELQDALQETAPFGSYFGAHPDDPACYGFWVDPDVVNNPADHDVLFPSAGTEPPADYRGALMFWNDHGNVSEQSAILSYVNTVILIAVIWGMSFVYGEAILDRIDDRCVAETTVRK